MNKSKIRTLLSKSILVSLFGYCFVSQSVVADEKLEKTVASEHRTARYAERDAFRHPVETLKFFGIKDTMTVVEISPGGGWYTEILAPYLKDNGTYIAAGYDPESEVAYYRDGAKKFNDKLAASPTLYGKAKLGIMQPPAKFEFAEANSADMIVSFRNTHNWHSRGYADEVYQAVFNALKPGGIFGVVQHRAGYEQPKDTSGKLGYLKQADVIKLATDAGFKLLDKSEINANPKDSKDHEKGVWSLPPSLDTSDDNKDKMKAIGESDRMTLKFVKPASK